MNENPTKPVKIDFDDYTVEYDESPEMKSRVFNYLIQEYYRKHKAFAGEVIQQDDDCILDAPDILSHIADEIIKFKETYKDK